MDLSILMIMFFLGLDISNKNHVQ